ncbi:MAG: MFS transporter [Candidatus Gracilibacteria bacterium]|nr:MFS transporter [Candidatus Gracilibacteria bacterium]
MHFGVGNAILINTISGLITLLFEVHSGGWADRFGRKKVFIFGLLSGIIGFSFYLWTTQVYLFLISAFFLGVGYALSSGTLEALIHDNLEGEGKVKEYNKIQSNQYIALFTGRALSSLLAGYLFFYNEYYPIIASIICYIIAIILVFFIHSPKQELSEETTNFKHIKKALVFLSEKKKMLFMIIFGGLLFSGIGNIYWFTYQPYLEQIGLNIKDVGIIYFFISAFSAFGSYIIKNILDKLKTFSILGFMFVGLIIISFMFSIFNNLLGLLPIILLSILFGFIMILGNTYLIENSPKTHKSTILSIFSFAGSIGYFTFGTLAGYMVQLFSLKAVYNTLPYIILIVFGFGLFYYRSIDNKVVD